MPSTSSARPRTLATAVFVTDPETRESLLLAPGTTVTDPALIDQITHPAAWAPHSRPGLLRRSRTDRQ
ncbi:hypothetical protein [Streptomyces mutabilis]|uniref:hypothetical protein n=1 Tax=Streptomyces mutabilis TaxID=67332 RepID=UPI0034DFA1DB